MQLTDFYFFDKESLRALHGPIRCLLQDSHRYASRMAATTGRDVLYLGSDYRGIAPAVPAHKSRGMHDHRA